jgi:hypothetical protein
MNTGKTDEPKIYEVNCIDELISLSKGAVVFAAFQTFSGSEEAFLVKYNYEPSGLVEFLEPEQKGSRSEDLKIRDWTCPADKLKFSGNGIVELPVAYRRYTCYSPEKKGYSERKELVLKLL